MSVNISIALCASEISTSRLTSNQLYIGQQITVSKNLFLMQKPSFQPSYLFYFKSDFQEILANASACRILQIHFNYQCSDRICRGCKLVREFSIPARLSAIVGFLTIAHEKWLPAETVRQRVSAGSRITRADSAGSLLSYG